MSLLMGRPARPWVSRLSLALLMLLEGCTAASELPTATPVPATATPPAPVTVAAPTAIPAHTPTVAATVAPAALAVEILAPANGAQVQGDGPVSLHFIANGGPFIEVVLWVDGKMSSVLTVSSPETSYEGTLQWPSRDVTKQMR